MQTESDNKTQDKITRSDNQQKKSSDTKELMSIIFFAGNLGFTMVLCILAGFFLGLWLDKIFGSNHFFLIIFLIAGIIAGFFQCYRLIKKDLKL